jgi:hypothetical protein
MLQVTCKDCVLSTLSCFQALTKKPFFKSFKNSSQTLKINCAQSQK